MRRASSLSALAITPLIAGACLASETEPRSVELSHRGYRTWDIQLPAETFMPVGQGIAIGAVETTFAASLDGASLRLDTDGDGELDRTIKPLEPGKTARVTLEAPGADGATQSYTVRLMNGAKGWSWSAGGAMLGTFGDERIRLIDQNLNGTYDDYGVDAMIVGRRDAASFLSRVVNIDGELFSIDVSADGRSIDYTPYEGATGELDMTTSFDSSARMLTAVIVSEDGEHSFDVATLDGAATIPAGTYRVHGGTIGLGKQTVQVAQGRMASIEVAADSETVFDWGGPVDAEFQYGRNGGEIVFSPDHIWFYGAAGEEYMGWHPIGKSPKFTLTSSLTGQVLQVAILPGST